MKQIIKCKLNKIIAGFTLSLLVLSPLALTGCGGPAKKAGTAENSEKEISMYDLNKAMCAAAEFPEMKNASDTDKDGEDSFAYISDMDYKKVKHFFVTFAADDGNTEEIAVIRVKDEGDVKEAEESLKDHLESRIKLFDQYEPDKVEELKDGEIFSKGAYAVLIVHKNKDIIKSEFDKNIS